MILWTRSDVAWRKDSSLGLPPSPSRISVIVAPIMATLLRSSPARVVDCRRLREAFTAPSQTATLRAAEQTATVLHSFRSLTRWDRTTRKAQREFVSLGIVCARRRRRARPCPQRQALAHEVSTPVNLQIVVFTDFDRPRTETRPPNQALQTTARARRVFGKVSEFGRSQRGV